MSYKLEKPYTDKQRADFIVEYNHNQGFLIEETDTALYALEPWEKLEDGIVVDNTEEYEAEQAQKERERIDMLSLTAADVERAIYKAKGMDFEDIVNLVNSEIVNSEQSDNPLVTTHQSLITPQPIDIKALKIEFKANNFYRGNPYIEQVGALLGFTPKMLDEFFETGDYTKLITATSADVEGEKPLDNAQILPAEAVIEEEVNAEETVTENSDLQMTQNEEVESEA